MADENVIVEEKYCYSCKRIKEYQYTWTCKIPRERDQTQEQDVVISPQFRTSENGEYQSWVIHMCFDHGNADKADYISFGVYPLTDEIGQYSKFNVMIKLSLIAKNNKQWAEQSISLTKENWRNVQFEKFLKADDLSNSPVLQPNGELKLMCRISFHAVNNQASHSEMPWSTLICRNVQMSHFAQMLNNPQFSDFQFIVGGTRIKVHKCILAAHSSVFAAIFQSDMIKKERNEVEIEDVDANIMRQLLRFIYVGEVENVDDCADKLLIAANKYQLNELKYLCEEKLIKKLTIDNLYEALLFVDNYHTTKLRDAAIQLVIRNSKKLSTMEKFKTSIENLSSILLAQVICAFMANFE